MHFGLVDSYNGLKRRSLERTIFVSGGLRSRYPPNHGRGKLTGPKPMDSVIFGLFVERASALCVFGWTDK